MSQESGTKTLLEDKQNTSKPNTSSSDTYQTFDDAKEMLDTIPQQCREFQLITVNGHKIVYTALCWKTRGITPENMNNALKSWSEDDAKIFQMNYPSRFYKLRPDSKFVTPEKHPREEDEDSLEFPRTSSKQPPRTSSKQPRRQSSRHMNMGGKKPRKLILS